MFNSREISIQVDEITLKGRLYVPNNGVSKHPVIVMAHGFASVKEMYLDKFAEIFASHGLAVLLFDNRCFGESGGSPRQEIDPWQQVEDYRNAITYAMTLEEIDANRIGVWGTSFSGGHALVLGATDKRIKCVVSQVPTISGFENAVRRGNAVKQDQLIKQFSTDRINRLHGEEPATLQVIPLEDNRGAVFHTADAIEWYTSGGEIAPSWKNYVTLRSVENTRSYEPGQYIGLISPTPLLLLVADQDYITPTDLALKAYERALEPKQLVILKGGHFDAYVKGFDIASKHAIDWFLTYL